jgi:hypothetical protein
VVLKGEILLSQDGFKQRNDLVGGFFVVVYEELCFGNVDSFCYWNIYIQVFDVQC